MKIDGNVTNSPNAKDTILQSSNSKNDNTKTDNTKGNESSVNDNGTIFAGNLNLGTDIENKRKQAQSIAMNLIEKAFAGDNAVDDEINSRKEHIDDLYKENSEAQDMINNISKEQEVVRKGYGIDENSQEEQDLELLRKERDSLLDSTVMLSDDEQARLKDIHEQGPTEYQKTMLEMDSNKSTYKKTIYDNKKLIVEENSVIRGIHLERLKTHTMVDANKQADKVMEAANKEIVGMLIEDSKDSIDDKFEEEQKEAEEKKEAEEELEERIEAAKAESEKTKKEDDQDEMYKLGDILNDVTNKKQNSNLPDVKKSLTLIVNELKLTADDLKGAVVDEDI